MRVAIIKNNGYIDSKIEKLLILNKINGDFITRFTRNSLKMYDVVIFSHKNNIPNLPKVLESIVLEQQIFVIYINNTSFIGEFYNILNDMYFSVINEQSLEIEFSSIINNSLKYIRKINICKAENRQLRNKLEGIELVNRAKKILMVKGLNEDESHKYIQRKSMDLILSKDEIANLIIDNKIDI